jgi:Zn-dependent peptidase ImmA (M78 family)
MDFMDARLEAAKLLRETNQRGPYVDLNIIAGHLNIQLWEVGMAPFEAKGITLSGILYYDGKKNIIFVNRDDKPNRKRFTVAHELGHYIFFNGTQTVGGNTILDYVLSQVDDYDFYSIAGKAEIIKSNAFAAELLMPLEALRELWKEGFRAASVLAARFAVSREAMQIRVNNCFTEIEV